MCGNIKWPKVGIVGGMGPAAGINFAQKLLSAAAAKAPVRCDQDSIPFVLWSNPMIPDRSAAALNPNAPDPYPALLTAVNGLIRADVGLIAIACSTAHHWHAKLSEACRIPIPHIAKCVAQDLQERSGLSRVGIIGTEATIELRIYETYFESCGIKSVIPTEHAMTSWIKPAILLAKQGLLQEAAPLVTLAIHELMFQEADAVVLGCSELPLILDSGALCESIPIIDSVASLASACVRLLEPATLRDLKPMASVA